MNQLDSFLRMLQEVLKTLVNGLVNFIDQYGYFVVIAIVITAVAKVFNFKIKV